MSIPSGTRVGWGGGCGEYPVRYAGGGGGEWWKLPEGIQAV